MEPMRVELREANAFVEQHHRHHKPVQGHRFSVGVSVDGELVGVAIVGRPVARQTDQKMVAEVLRCCTDGTKNACTWLYGACARIAATMGFESVQTFVLPDESGGSLVAAGWECVGQCKSAGAKGWHSRKERRSDQPESRKIKWRKSLT